jgi:hypothetical protein
MSTRGFLFAAAALAGMLMTTTADAQQQPPVGTKVDIYGCVGRSLDNLCPIITDRKTGAVYTISSATPQPDPAKHLVVHLKGTVVSLITFCWSGPILGDITWRYTRMRCPRPK